MDVLWTVIQVFAFLAGLTVYVIVTSPNFIAEVIIRTAVFLYKIAKPLFTRPGEMFEIPEGTFKIEEEKNEYLNPELYIVNVGPFPGVYGSKEIYEEHCRCETEKLIRL